MSGITYESVFGKTPEVTIAAQKKPTAIYIYLWDEGRRDRREGQTVFVGTTIRVEASLWEKLNGLTGLLGKPIKIYHRLEPGAWEEVFSGTPNVAALGPNWYLKTYTVPKAGTHIFYAEFFGDDVYEGCLKEVRTLARRCPSC